MKKLCSYRFDDQFLTSLARLANLEMTNKTEIIKKSVLLYMDDNLDRLKARDTALNMWKSVARNKER
jgi:hypothetical protein